MPSFGDGHAHPMLGGLESVGPPVRPCQSVAEIVEAVREFAERHPELEWITGASYDGSLAPEGLFDARWLDEAVPDRPVVLRAWDYHTVWCNTAALRRGGITPTSPTPCSVRFPTARTVRCSAPCANGAQSTWSLAHDPAARRGGRYRRAAARPRTTTWPGA